MTRKLKANRAAVAPSTKRREGRREIDLAIAWEQVFVRTAAVIFQVHLGDERRRPSDH